MIVGYTSSPGGLNGEGHMAEWIRESLTPQVFDLTRQELAFRIATSDALSDIAGIEQPELINSEE
jgi:hypothetical protein